MFVNTAFKRVIFNFAFIFVFLSIYILLFYRIYTSNEVIIPFALHPFNICEKYPEIWQKLKAIFIPISFTSTLICSNTLYSSIFKKKKILKSTPFVQNKTRFILNCCK